MFGRYHSSLSACARILALSSLPPLYSKLVQSQKRLLSLGSLGLFQCPLELCRIELYLPLIVDDVKRPSCPLGHPSNPRSLKKSILIILLSGRPNFLGRPRSDRDSTETDPAQGLGQIGILPTLPPFLHSLGSVFLSFFPFGRSGEVPPSCSLGSRESRRKFLG